MAEIVAQQQTDLKPARPAAAQDRSGPTTSGPSPHPVGRVGELHRAIGNQGVGRLLQRKLTINEPGDSYEQEADRVAEDVMQSDAPSQTPLPIGRAPVSAQPLQRSCSCGGTCADCQEEQALQRKQVSGIAVAGAGHAAPPIVHDVLRTSGRPLDAQTRAFMEPRFGRNFANVRIHTDGRAAESARAVNARAYTVGNAIAFGAGAYTPDSQDGRQLLAHELTHVVQQNGAGANANRGAPVQLRAAPAVQRDAFDELSEEDKKRLINSSAQCGTGQCHPGQLPAKGSRADIASAPFDAAAMAAWIGAGPTPKATPKDAPSQPAPIEKKAHAPGPPNLRPGAGKPTSLAANLQGLAPEMTKEEMARLAVDMRAADAARRLEESQKRVLADGTVISLAPPPQPLKAVIPPPKPGELTRDLEAKIDASGRTVTLAKANVEGERARIIHNIDVELRRVEDIGDMCRSAAHRFLEEWPILRRLADLTGGANPPSEVIWNEVDRQIEKSRTAIRNGDLEAALESAEQANRALRNAQATWGRYKDRNIGGAETLQAAAENTRDASKYTLMALAIVASGGTASLVATAATTAIDVADAASRAALGEKVDWSALAIDIVINIITAKFGGKLSQRMLGKLLVNPAAQGIASRYLVQAIHSVINGAESRLIRGYIQGLYKTVTTPMTADEFIDQLLAQLFDPKSIVIDTILGLGRGYALGRPSPRPPPEAAAEPIAQPTKTAPEPNTSLPKTTAEPQVQPPSKPVTIRQPGEPQLPTPEPKAASAPVVDEAIPTDIAAKIHEPTPDPAVNAPRATGNAAPRAGAASPSSSNPSLVTSEAIDTTLQPPAPVRVRRIVPAAPVAIVPPAKPVVWPSKAVVKAIRQRLNSLAQKEVTTAHEGAKVIVGVQVTVKLRPGEPASTGLKVGEYQEYHPSRGVGETQRAARLPQVPNPRGTPARFGTHQPSSGVVLEPNPNAGEVVILAYNSSEPIPGSNVSHAEVQAIHFLENQDPRWLARVESVEAVVIGREICEGCDRWISDFKSKLPHASVSFIRGDGAEPD
jgi:hypothetical protein